MRVLTVCLLVLCSWGTMAAQDVAPQLSGRLVSSWNWVETGGQTAGLVTGWTGVTGGTKDVKSEVRLGLTNLPVPTVGLQRAWVKFRVPGTRVTTGLGRLAWGTGLVLVPGDLLFDSLGAGLGKELDFGNDELRTSAAWLGDVWVALGEEAFAEAAVLQNSVGARVSAAPGGVTLEAAGAWDRGTNGAKAALSTQIHLGVDWYATVRQDTAADHPVLSPEGTSCGLGAFGLWDLGEGMSLTSRHEAWAANPGAVRMKSYHDLILAFDAGWSLGARLLIDSFPDSAIPSAEVRWSALQNLSLFVTALPLEPRAVSVGCSARW